MFEFCINVRLKWDSAAASSKSPPRIYADVRLEVDVETPPPFRLVPRSLLETIVSGGTQVVLDALLKAFLTNLAADYGRWASSAQYREARRESLQHAVTAASTLHVTTPHAPPKYVTKSFGRRARPQRA